MHHFEFYQDFRRLDHPARRSQGTNLEYVMLKAGYDEDLTMEWVTMSHLYIISHLGFHYCVGLHTHLWKVATTYSWRHAELQTEQHVKEIRQIRQSRGTRLQVVRLTYIYFRDQHGICTTYVHGNFSPKKVYSVFFIGLNFLILWRRFR
jgi:hypothetical protein